MKKCNRCGEENKDENNFCRNCGFRLDASWHNHNNKFIVKFSNTNRFYKLIIILSLVFIFLLVFAYSCYVFFGIPLEPYTEGDSTYSQSQFDSLDIDGDGALDFYEVEGLASDISYDNLSDMFDKADKNHNGLLKGAEFDGYLYHIDKYYKNLKKQEKAQNKTQQQHKSSKSSSNLAFQREGHEICPICGGDQFSEFYNAQYGEMNWQCDYCGKIFRSDDEFYMD